MRGSRPERGVTLVELLVTIVISTLFFAALVPVFVFAQKQSSGDRARVIAANVAQAKLETVRSVDYTLLDEDAAYFTSSEGVAAGFGSTFPNEEGGPVKTYTIDYDVDFVYSAQNPSEVVYKLVTVDVFWTGPPKPIKHVILKTAVYPQYKGPEIGQMTVGDPPLEDGDILTTLPAPVKARVESIDLDQTDYVRFSISATNGSYVEVKDVQREQADAEGWFAWPGGWTGVGAGDGNYLFTAVAVSVQGRLGEHWNLQYTLDRGAPATPKFVLADCQAGDGVVSLRWSPPLPVAGDLASYQIVRTGGAGALPSPPLNKASTTYIDRTAQNGTTYTYTVFALDERGNISTPTGDASVTLTPAVPTDTVRPTAPSGVSAVLIGQSVTLTWSSNPTVQDVTRYRIYRLPDDAGRTSPIAVIDRNTALSTYSYIDPQIGWNRSCSYYLTAVDAALNESDPGTATSTIVTPAGPPQQTFRLTVKVSGSDAIVMVASLVDGSVYDISGNRIVGDKSVAQIFVQSGKKGVTFSNLPYSTYRVTVTFVNKQRVPIASPKYKDVELVRDEPSIDFTLQ